MIDPQDICMLKNQLFFLTIILAVITLFHGISSGLLAILILVVAMKFGYPEFYYEDFLKELALVLIFGNFHYSWNRKLTQCKTKSKFTKQKLSELSTAFYMLKISHDKMEKSYVVKPMSLRNSIRTIKDDFYKDEPNIFYHSFLLLLQKTLNIEKAFLLSVKEGNKMEILAQTDKNALFDEDDLMIQNAYDKQIPLYVSSDDKYNVSKYLAAIPILSNDRIVGILVIENIPFMSFNKDNLISATILVNYMFDEVYKLETLKTLDDLLPEFQENFRFEVHRLFLLSKQFGNNSTVLVYKTDDKLKTHILIEAVNKNLRSLDIMSSASIEEMNIVAILFPFSDTSSTEGFIKRINDSMKVSEDSEIIKHSTFSISEMDLIRSYMDDEK